MLKNSACQRRERFNRNFSVLLEVTPLINSNKNYHEILGLE